MFKPRLCDPNEVQPGDLIGFSGHCLVSGFINLMTFGIPGWSLSHVGIMGEYNGRLLLFESTSLDPDPCEISGKLFCGSQAHSLDAKLRSYPGKVWHYPAFRSLFPHERRRLNQFLRATLGMPYDRVGAFRAGGYGFSWLEARLREADLHSLFCSEWCAAAHAEIGLFVTDNVARWSPNLLVRTERHAGILRKPRRLK